MTGFGVCNFLVMQDISVKISNLELINYKKFINTTITFAPQLTVLSGKNGAGKTSVMSGVSLILSWIIARMRNDSGVGLYVPALSVNNSAHSGCVKGEIFSGVATVPSKAKPGYSKEYSLDITPIKGYAAAVRAELQNGPDACLPVFAFYGVKRAVFDMPLRTRSHDYTIFDAYDRCLEGAANFRSFFTWFRACEDWENERRVRQGNNVEHPGLQAFRRAMERFMPQYTNIRIERHPLRMMLDKNGTSLNAEQLSDGEKIYLALIGDLCHRLSIANPIGDPLLGKGIVLIDEIDLHLHPQWQSEIATKLINTFPNIQFIVSTHSPHVINSVPTASLRLMNEDDTISEAPYGYGMPSEIVLGDIMDLDHDVPSEIVELLSRFNTALGNGDVAMANEVLTALQHRVPQHPELPRMRKKVERLSR
ncbi:MAG: AAA family ATPase [Bacteroides sp.]|nr:AAA family ATPase [Bacteroides sp.]